jgi:DNA-binding NarL/FixJ family response regulator
MDQISDPRDSPETEIILVTTAGFPSPDIVPAFALAPRISVVRTALTLHEALAAMTTVKESAQQIIILGVTVISIALRIDLEAARQNGAAIIALFDSDELRIADIISLPASGFMDLHDLRPETVDRAIKMVRLGELAFPDSLNHRLLTIARKVVDPPRQRIRISIREQEALRFLVEGLTNKQIGRRMGISEHGVKRLVASIMAKLQCNNRTLAVSRALQEGWTVGPVPDRSE